MKALILGGVAPHIELMEELKERGYETILVDYLQNPPARKFADKFYRESTLDKEKVLEIAKTEEVDLIITICVDHANVTMCYVAEQLHLPCPYSYETAIMATDKALMKQKMVEYGIPTADFKIVESVAQLDREWEFPLVVKPVDNNGSKGVKKVETRAMLEQAVVDAIQLSRAKRAVVESFNEGREIQVDCFANNKEAHVIMKREKLKIPNQKGLAMQSFGSLIPVQMSERVHEKIADISNRIVKAFQLEHTPFFFQAILSGEDIKVLELSPRIGGGLSYKLLKQYASFPIIPCIVDSYFGNIKDVNFGEGKGYMTTNILYGVNGTFDHVVGVEELLNKGIIDGFDQMAESGNELAGYMDSRNRIGAYYISAASYEELMKKVAIAHDKIDVVDKTGKSIARKDLYLKEQ